MKRGLILFCILAVITLIAVTSCNNSTDNSKSTSDTTLCVSADSVSCDSTLVDTLVKK